MLELTFGRAVDHLVLLIGMLQDALGTEHFLVVHAKELDLFLRVLLAVLDRAVFHGTCYVHWVGGRSHWKPGQHLIVHWQVVHWQVMGRLVIRTLYRLVLWQLLATFLAEWVTTLCQGWFYHHFLTDVAKQLRSQFTKIGVKMNLGTVSQL